ncbi:putative membrane protein [Gordonia polyisoprenivorans VH2]|uniref:Putative membrane protein n=1 Tax=Gordonia polyisoprenivorans (strain DSM 44266 / VH2) TaxID=1112204 RepID=H6MSX2_GORPV|nr:putative membrane protein [Gordonia polyisoprenivorans VH2]
MWGQPAGANVPYPQNPYGDPYTPKPSGGTAITATVLSFLGGVSAIVGLIVSIGVLVAISALATEVDRIPGWYNAVLVMQMIVDVVLAVLLIWGGVSVLRHKMIGRILVASGCGVSIVFGIVGAIAGLAVESALSHNGVSNGFGSGVFSFVGLIFPIATAILVMLPSTAEWIKAG